MPVMQPGEAVATPPRGRRAASSAGRFRQALLDYYAVAAAGYDSWAGGAHLRAAQRLADIAKLQPGESVLDVGCGTGVATHRMSLDSRGGFAFGIDISSHMLAVAHANRPKGSDAVFALMPAEELLMRSDCFDAVVFGQTVAYLLDPAIALGEAHRVLRSGGRIIVSGQRRKLSTAAENVFFMELARLADRSPLDVPRPPKAHAWFGEPDVLASLLITAGFSEVETTGFVTGGHTTDAAGWLELMTFAGPYPHALLSHLGDRLRGVFLKRLEHAAGQLSDDPFRYHRAFTFAIARRP